MDEEKNEREHRATELQRGRGAQIYIITHRLLIYYFVVLRPLLWFSHATIFCRTEQKVKRPSAFELREGQRRDSKLRHLETSETERPLIGSAYCDVMIPRIISDHTFVGGLFQIPIKTDDTADCKRTTDQTRIISESWKGNHAGIAIGTRALYSTATCA